MLAFSSKKKFLWIYISACVFVLLYAWYYYPFVADDSFISFRYADRLLEGKGLTWTDGPPVEGYSNLLWVLLMALLKYITHAELWIISWATNFSCSIITLWLLLRIIGRATDYNTFALVVSGGLFAVSASVAIWINGGMESALIMVLLVAAIFFIMRDIPRRNGWAPGIFLGLLSLTRPDGLLFTWSISLGLVLFCFFSSTAPLSFRKLQDVIVKNFKLLLLLNLIPLLFYGGQLLFRLSYYGEWVPNTALVKVSFTLKRIGEGFHYVASMLKVYSPFLALAVYFALKATPKYRAWLIFLATIVLISSLYLTVVGGDTFPGFRHCLPLVPLLCGLGGLVFMLLMEKLRVHTLGFSVMAAATLLVVFILQLSAYSNRRAILERWEWDSRNIGETMQEGFESWQPSIAVSAAGAEPYFSRLPTLDLLGLNDYYLPRHRPKNFGQGVLGHELGDADYYLRQLPDIFLLNGYGVSPDPYFLDEEMRMFKMEQFRSQYVGVKLVCHFNYSLRVPLWQNGWKFNIRSDEPGYPFIRKYSQRVGIRRTGKDTILAPAWFFINRRLPDTRSVIQLNDQKQLVLAIPPGESFFLPKGFLSPFLREDQLTGCRFISGSSPDLPLTVSLDRGEIEVSNPWSVSVGLMEVRVLVCGDCPGGGNASLSAL
jgi:hypothetical protein